MNIEALILEEYREELPHFWGTSHGRSTLSIDIKESVVIVLVFQAVRRLVVCKGID
jgi:hypothetical protein